MMNEGVIYGLIFKCPFNDELSDCPIKQLRSLSIQEKLTKLSKLTCHDKLQYVIKHKECLHLRENDLKNL